MQNVDVNGLSVAFQRAGSGPAIVFLHGFILDSRSWQPQLDGLSDRFTVFAWDAPGTGESEDPPGSFGIEDWADSLARVLDTAGIDRASVVGLSWGGLLAQEFYRRHPARVTSLVLAGTYAGWKGSLPAPVPEQRLAACIEDSSLPADAFVAKYLPGMLGDAPDLQVQDQLGRIMVDFHRGGFRLMATALARADTRDFLPAIKVPTLLIWGDADKRSPLGFGEAMREAIPGATLTVIRSAGHLSNLERPAEFNGLIRDFCGAEAR